DQRSLEGDSTGQGGRQACLGARVAGTKRPRRRDRLEPLADGRALLLVEFLGDSDDAGEQEECEAKGEERVADRGHVLDDREGDRDDVGKGSERQEEVSVEFCT